MPTYGTEAYTEFQGLLMREYIYLLIYAEWGFITLYTDPLTPYLSPEWNINSNNAGGVATNNPLGHDLYTDYISKVISPPDIATIDLMFNANLPFNLTQGVASYSASL